MVLSIRMSGFEVQYSDHNTSVDISNTSVGIAW